MFDGYVLRKVFEIFRQVQEISNETRGKSFLFNMDSSDQEVIVIVAIALNVLDDKPTKKHKRKLLVKPWLQMILLYQMHHV